MDNLAGLCTHQHVMDIAPELLSLVFKHSIDGKVVVEGKDGDRQIFAHGFQVNRQIGGQGGLADPAFLG